MRRTEFYFKNQTKEAKKTFSKTKLHRWAGKVIYIVH